MKEDQTKPDNYEPTTAEKKLLEVLLNPENRFLPKTVICQKAGIHRQTYYDAFAKPEFVKYYRGLAVGLVDQHVLQVVQTFVKQAVAGSYQHGKAILDMAELSKDKLLIEATTKNINLETDDPKELSRIYQEEIKGGGK